MPALPTDQTPPQVEKLLDAQQRGGVIRLFARVTLQPGQELAYHEHHGDAEAYYILSGEGLYCDNGGPGAPVGPGSVTFCPDGGGHSVRCTGDAPLVFLALIY